MKMYLRHVKRFSVTCVIVISIAPRLLGQEEAARPLQEAVDAVNDEMAAYPFDVEGIRNPPLAPQQLPSKVTIEEVEAAIKNWDRATHPVEDSTYRLYREIAETKELPSGASVEFSSFWHHYDKADTYEYRVCWIDLLVMTGPNSGFGFRVRDQTLDRRIALMPSDGFSWIIDPVPIEIRSLWNSDVVFFIEAREGTLLATAAWSHNPEAYDHRFVAFDKDGQRYVLDRDRTVVGGATSQFVLARFRLTPEKLKAPDVAFIGLEALDPEGLRRLAHAAVERAKQDDHRYLSLPQAGEPLDYELLTTDSMVLKPQDFQGKVLLIDCWASWCGPCMQKMPELKAIYDRWHKNGLEVIGISWDEDAKAAAGAVEALAIPWPQIVVPTDETTRELWREANRIQELPTMLLVDQQGILRGRFTSISGLEERIGQLIEERSR